MTKVRAGALAILGTAAAVALAACMPQAPEVAGRALYAENCAVCHGPAGRGDGPAAAGLARPPADLTGLAAANRGVFPMARIMSYVDGYTRGGGDMPDFGDLLDGPRLIVDTGDGIPTPTPAPLVALAEYLRGLQR